MLTSRSRIVSWWYESWWKTISPKLAGAKDEPDEKSAITLRRATMAVVATRSYANGGSDKSVRVGEGRRH